MLILLQVLYNKAYCLWQINDRAESKRLLDEALGSAAECSESRHRVVSTALDQIKVITTTTTTKIIIIIIIIIIILVQYEDVHLNDN